MRVFTFFGIILCVIVVLAPPAWGNNDLDALVKTIRTGNKEARVSALQELADMGKRGRSAVSAILPLLRDKDKEIRQAAAYALEGIGPGPEAIPLLLESMKDKDKGCGWSATDALVAVGPAAIPAFTRALQDSDADVRSMAVYGLSEFGPAAKDSMPALVAMYAKETTESRVEIINAWAEIGRGAKSATTLLGELLRDNSIELRFAAARALWKIERRPERVVPTLIEIVEFQENVEQAADRTTSEKESPEENPQSRAAELLGQIGPEARRAVPALMEAMKTRDITLCDCAIEALGEIGPEAKQAIPAIVERLGDHRKPKGHNYGFPAVDWELGTSAWIALGEMGPEAAVALIPALKHKDKEVRLRAVFALKNLGPDALPALDALVASLGDPEEEVRRYAAYALGEIGSAARSALPALLQATKDPSRYVREAALDALPLVAPKSPAVVASLIEALEDSDGTVQAHAAMSLGKLGAAARPAVPLMAKLLSSEQEYYTRSHPTTSRSLSDCVAAVLGDLGPVAKEAVPALVGVAGRTRDINWEAIPAIGKIGPEAKTAIPFLLRDATPESATAIAQIDPDNAEVLAILRQVWQSPALLMAKRGVYPDHSWCYVMGCFGPRAKPAISALEELLDRPDPESRMGVAVTVLEIDPTHKRALDVCVAALAQRSREFPETGSVIWGIFLDSDLEERLDQLMVALGPRSRAFVPTLCEVLKNYDSEARISAAERLAVIGSEAAEAVPTLIRAMVRRDHPSYRDDDVRKKAVTALARIGLVAVPPLIKALADEDVFIRAGAANTLGRIGAGASMAIPALADSLKDERLIVRDSAAMALRRMGPTAAEAVPALTRALRDEYSLVRCSSAEALGAIGAAAQTATSALMHATHDEFLTVREAAKAAMRKIATPSNHRR